MHPRRFALIGGLIMLLMGALAFIPALNSDPVGLPVLNLDTSYGVFLNIFPMNVLNKVVLILFGIAGIYAWSDARGTSLPNSILFSKVTFVVMGIAAILGLIPSTNTLSGYWPLFGAEVWAHGVFAIVGAYFGYSLRAKYESQNRGEQTRAAEAEGRL